MRLAIWEGEAPAELTVAHEPTMAPMLHAIPMAKKTRMMTTAIVMQLMGWAMIKKIVNIKV